MAFDADLLRTCADPSLKPAIVEQFVKQAGSPDPLAVTVRSGSRVILVPPLKTPEQALEVVREHLGKSVVRVGITQYPAGVGIRDVSELSPQLLQPCDNIRMGTALFGKVWRVVLKWYGNPTAEDVMTQAVFTAPDPGETKAIAPKLEDAPQSAPVAEPQETPADDPSKSGIRIDLSGIGGRAP